MSVIRRYVWGRMKGRVIGMTVICLMRHGETDWNQQQRIQGRSNISLNERGIQQAKDAREAVWKTKWNKIYTSPLTRAKQTAHILQSSSSATIHIEEAFIEKSFGDVEGKSYTHVFSTHPDGVYPNAETDEDVVMRILDQFTKIQAEHPNERILVVTHGAVIHALLAHFDVIPTGLEYIVLHHLCMNTFRYHQGKWEVTSFNDKPK